MRNGCPKIGSLGWWPGVVIRFSLGLLSPDRTLRGGDSQKMEAGKVTLQGSLTHAQSLPRGGGWRSGVRGGGERGKVCCRVGPASSCAGKCPTPPHASPGPSQLGQRDPGPGSSRRQVASSSASINRRGSLGRPSSGSASASPSVPSGGSRPAAAARTCGSPRGALPRQLQPPRPGLQEPRPGCPARSSDEPPPGRRARPGR